MELPTLLFFIPMIIFLGLVTSYEDIRFGKIRNIWVISSLIYAFLVNALLFLFLRLSGASPRPGYFLELFVSFLIALFIGYIMWNVGIWTSGDAKLYASYTLLLPLSVYSYGHINYFSSFNIIVNTFVPFFIYYSFLLLFRTTLKQKLFYLKKSLEPKQLLALSFFIFAFTWPVQLFFSYFDIPGTYFLAIFILFIMLVITERLFRLNIAVVSLIIAPIRIIFDKSLFTAETLIFLAIVIAAFIFLRLFMLSMGYDLLTKEYDIGLLEAGMVPAERVFREGSAYKKEPLLFFSLLECLGQSTRKRDYVIRPAAEGLTSAEVARLKRLEKRLGFEHLKVYQTIAFAPYMFGGVLLTIAFSGNIFIVLRLLFP